MRRYAIIYLVLTLFLLFGCSAEKDNLGDSYVLGQDDQFFYSSNPYSQRIAESEDGYYFFSGPYQLFLYYMDKKTMSPVVLCNKPDCLHADESDPSKVANCNACMPDSNNNITYYEDSLYVGGVGSDGYSIYQISVDGTSRKKIFTISGDIEQWIIHRGYLYYSTNDNGTIQGNEATTNSSCRLYKVDLNRTQKDPEMLYEVRGIYECTLKLLGFGNGVYWNLRKFSDESQKKLSFSLMKYSILDDSTIEFKDDVSFVSAIKDKILVKRINGILCTISQDGSNMEEIGKIGESSLIYSDGVEYIFCDSLPIKLMNREDTGKEKTERRVTVYNVRGEQICEIDVDNLGKDWVYGGNKDYFFIPDFESQSNEFGQINILWVIDKKMIGEASLSPTKIFKFVPKGSFPGIITTAD